jgi:hypothetical protein
MAGHGKRNKYKCLSESLKKNLESTKCKQEENINMDLNKSGWRV